MVGFLMSSTAHRTLYATNDARLAMRLRSHNFVDIGEQPGGLCDVPSQWFNLEVGGALSARVCVPVDPDEPDVSFYRFDARGWLTWQARVNRGAPLSLLLAAADALVE